MLHLFIICTFFVGGAIAAMRRASWTPIIYGLSVVDKSTSFFIATINTIIYMLFWSACSIYAFMIIRTIALITASIAAHLLFLSALLFAVYFIPIILFIAGAALVIFYVKKQGKKLPKIRTILPYIFNHASLSILSFIILALFIFSAEPIVTEGFLYQHHIPAFIPWLVYGALAWLALVFTISITTSGSHQSLNRLLFIKKIFYATAWICLITSVIHYRQSLGKTLTEIQERREANQHISLIS